jgi:hypothetical protein
MYKKYFFLYLIVFLFLQNGCSKRMLISYDQLQKENLVQIKTKSNTSYNGIVKTKKPDFVILQTARNSKALSKIAKKRIYSIHAKPPVYDDQKKVISEWEVQDNQHSKYTMLYAIGGAGLSFGASFFIGSLIHRGMSDSEHGNTLLWSTTGGGTVLGAYLFTRRGKHKDRQASILDIRERRFAIAQKDMAAQKGKSKKIKKDLNKIKDDRQKQKREIERLKKRIKERENKNEGEPD